MRMTYNLFNQLMGTLVCVHFSAYGIPKTEEQKEKITQTARDMAVAILESFERKTGEKWDIGWLDEQEYDENVDK